MQDHFEGHAHPIFRGYELIRCEKCKELMKVPFEDMQFECQNCSNVIVFEVEEEELNETDA